MASCLLLTCSQHHASLHQFRQRIYLLSCFLFPCCETLEGRRRRRRRLLAAMLIISDVMHAPGGDVNMRITSTGSACVRACQVDGLPLPALLLRKNDRYVLSSRDKRTTTFFNEVFWMLSGPIAWWKLEAFLRCQ